MKVWKKYLALLTALLLVMSFAACTFGNEEPSEPAAEQTETPTNEMPTEEATDAPTEEATEETTVASADYSAYMGQWHSGTVTLKVEAENKWSMEENGDAFVMGQIVVNEEDGSLHLYDVEGTEAARLILDGDDSLYAELYTEDMYNRIEDFFFSREKSNVDIGADIIDDAGGEDSVLDSGNTDETVGEG